MTKTIAVVGKGGVGKTTISAILVKLIPGLKLVVDADPNANLNDLLGVKAEKMIGIERDKIKNSNSTMSKQDQLKLLLNQCIIECRDYDLLVMGRPEGKGCYCSANSMLKESLDVLSKNYPVVIIDCAGGMEHISRLVIEDIDVMFIVANKSPREVRAGIRIKELTEELGIKVRKMFVIINRASELDEALVKEINDNGLEIIGYVPDDDIIEEFDNSGKPIFEIPDTGSVGSVRQILKRAGVL